MKKARSFRAVPGLLAAGVLALAGIAQAVPAPADGPCFQPPGAGQICPLDDHESWHDAYVGVTHEVQYLRDMIMP